MKKEVISIRKIISVSISHDLDLLIRNELKRENKKKQIKSTFFLEIIKNFTGNVFDKIIKPNKKFEC